MKRQAKQLARELFLNGRYSRKELAEMVGVTEKTLRRWIEAENWEKLKISVSITRKKLLQEAYQQLDNINQYIKNELNGIPNKEMADAKAVIRKEIETLSDRPLYQYIEVTEELIEYIGKTDPKKLVECTETIRNFIERIAKEQNID